MRADDPAALELGNLHDTLAEASTEEIRLLMLANPFGSQSELAMNFVAAMLWNADAEDLARFTGLSLQATKAVQELVLAQCVKFGTRS